MSWVTAPDDFGCDDQSPTPTQQLWIARLTCGKRADQSPSGDDAKSVTTQFAHATVYAGRQGWDDAKACTASSATRSARPFWYFKRRWGRRADTRTWSSQ